MEIPMDALMTLTEPATMTMFTSGLTDEIIANRTGVDFELVQVFRERMGIETEHIRQRFNAKAKTKYAKLQDADWLREQAAKRDDASIAAELGCGDSTVCMYRIRHGIPSFHRPSRLRTPEKLKDGEWLLNALKGRTVKDVATEIGISHTTVITWRNKHLGVDLEAKAKENAKLRKHRTDVRSKLQDANWLRAKAATMPDKAIAEELGCARTVVVQHRHMHHIRPFQPPGRQPVSIELTDPAWLREAVKTKFDKEIAVELGCATATVAWWRKQHGIDPHNGVETDRYIIKLRDADWLRAQAKEKYDQDIAVELGCSRGAVSQWRERHGIPTHDELAGRSWSLSQNQLVKLQDADWLREQVATLSDGQIAKQLGCTVSAVYYWREKLGIVQLNQSKRNAASAATRKRNSKHLHLLTREWIAERYERMTDEEMADELECSASTVHQHRLRYGFQRTTNQAKGEERWKERLARYSKKRPPVSRHLAETELMARCKRCGYVATPTLVYEGKAFGWVMEPDQKLRQTLLGSIEHVECGSSMLLYGAARLKALHAQMQAAGL